MAAGVLPSRPMSKWFCTLALLLASTAHAVHATPTTSSPETNDVVDHWMMNPPEVIDRWLAPQKTKPVVASAQIDSVADRWMMNPHEVIDRWMNQGSAKATDKASSMMSQLDAARNDVADKTADLVTTAMGLLGVPYRRGGNSAETGFDCSGFVRSIYSQTVGMVLPRRAAEQAAATQTIDKKELKPGDLVFFNTCAAPSATWASTLATANLCIHRAPAKRCGSKACKILTGKSALTALAVSSITP